MVGLVPTVQLRSNSGARGTAGWSGPSPAMTEWQAKPEDDNSDEPTRTLASKAARKTWRRATCSGPSASARADGSPRCAISHDAGSAAADLVMPPLCLSCYSPLAAHDALCPACWQGVAFIRPPLCDRLGQPLPYDTGGA